MFKIGQSAILVIVVGVAAGCGEPDGPENIEAAGAPADEQTPFREIEFPASELGLVGLPATPGEQAANRSWQENRLANFRDSLRELPDGAARADRATPTILKGFATAGYSAVGYVINKQHDVGRCTGTLVSCNAVLTADHCFKEGDVPVTDATRFQVFFQHAGLVNVRSMHRICDDIDDCDPDLDDLAIAILEETPRIAPYQLVEPGDWATGNSAVIVGFGVSGTESDRGLKRVGSVSPLDCMDADNCFELVEDHSNCTADSGGPLLIPDGNTHKVLGVAVFGGFCDQVQGRYLSMLHEAYAEWADSTIEEGACSSSVLQSATALPGSIRVEDDLMNVAIQSGSGNLQANLNFERGYGNKLKLAVPADASCDASGEAVSCNLPGPYGGNEAIVVQRKDDEPGKAFYQLTVVPQ